MNELAVPGGFEALHAQRVFQRLGVDVGNALVVAVYGGGSVENRKGLAALECFSGRGCEARFREAGACERRSDQCDAEPRANAEGRARIESPGHTVLHFASVRVGSLA